MCVRTLPEITVILLVLTSYFYHILTCDVETWWLVVRGVFAWRSCFVSALAAGMATGAAVGVAAGAAGWVIGRAGGWKGW